MAKAKQPEAIQGLLQQTLKASGLGHLLHESRLRERWKELMGERAAKIAEMESLKDGQLHIRVSDSVWRQELMFQREALRRKANDILGSSVVKEIRLR
jgi:predicted nucleic acid-binding Zn ribbon protein